MDGAAGSNEVVFSERLLGIEAKAKAAGFATERITDSQGGWLKVNGEGWHLSFFGSAVRFAEAEWQSGWEPIEVMVERTAQAVAAYRLVATP